MASSETKKAPKPVPAHEHVYEEHWFPLDRSTTRRVCTYPRCTEMQTRKSTA